MGMQQELVEKICEWKADDVIGLKDNRPKLPAEMLELVNTGRDSNFERITTEVPTETEKAHRVIEGRPCP